MLYNCKIAWKGKYLINLYKKFLMDIDEVKKTYFSLRLEVNLLFHYYYSFGRLDHWILKP